MLDIFPVGSIFLVKAVHDVHDVAIGIDGSRALLIELFVGECPSTDTEDCVGIKELSRIIVTFELHSIGVEGEDDIRLPDNLRRSYGSQSLEDGYISHVSFACCSQTPVECDIIALGLRTAVSELLGGATWTHGMATAWATTYTEYLLDCFHYNVL